MVARDARFGRRRGGLTLRGCAGPALALVLTACGGGGGGGPISTPAPAPPPAPAPVPTPTPTPPASVFNTAEFRQSSGAAQHGAITAWDSGRTGAGQAIAIIDTGIDTTNSEFAGRILPASRDVTGAGRSIQAEDDHGTNVALVAAAARNGVGVMGIAFDASLLVLRTDRPGSCTGAAPGSSEANCAFGDNDIAAGVNAAVAAGARVINISLGGKSPVSAGLADAVRRASSAGIVIVVAAGNGGTGNRVGVDPGQPNVSAASVRAAGGDNVIIVGSVDAGGVISSFSQRAGAEAAWYLTARGERVCCVYDGSQLFVGRDENGAYNLSFSGTSFATPQVAGAVALLAQAFPGLTGQQIVRLLLDTARDAGAAGVDTTYGAGVLDIAAALAPRGAMTLAGSTAIVRPGMEVVTGSPAMGDAPARTGSVQGIALDSYARAYTLELGGGVRGAAFQPRLAAALAPGAQVARGGANSVALAFTVGHDQNAARTSWPRPLQLSGEAAEGARLLAAQVALRVDARSELALALRDSAAGLTAQLRGAREPAFLIARSAGADSGFVLGSDAAFAMRREMGALGVTIGAERGAVWRQRDLVTDGALPGGPRDRLATQQLSLALDRAIGPVDGFARVSWLAEDASVLGASVSAPFGMRGADTVFLDLAAGMDLAAGWQLDAAWRQGWTRLRAAGLIAPGPALASSGWSVDVSRADALLAGDSLGVRLSQPLRVNSGGIGLRLPVAYDYATLLPSHATRFIALAPSGREIDAELAWRGPLWGGSAAASLYYRTDPGHYAALPDDKGAALRWELRF